MSILSGFSTSKVQLLKQSGKVYEDINAVVEPDMIFIEDDSLPIEEGDYIIRKLSSNSLEEKYVVLDRGFYEAEFGEKAHYQCKVKKTSTLELTQQPQNVFIICMEKTLG